MVCDNQSKTSSQSRCMLPGLAPGCGEARIWGWRGFVPRCVPLLLSKDLVPDMRLSTRPVSRARIGSFGEAALKLDTDVAGRYRHPGTWSESVPTASRLLVMLSLRSLPIISREIAPWWCPEPFETLTLIVNVNYGTQWRSEQEPLMRTAAYSSLSDCHRW